eukprot:3292544-Rhodomonas_salina.1
MRGRERERGERGGTACLTPASQGGGQISRGRFVDFLLPARFVVSDAMVHGPAERVAYPLPLCLFAEILLGAALPAGTAAAIGLVGVSPKLGAWFGMWLLTLLRSSPRFNPYTVPKGILDHCKLTLDEEKLSCPAEITRDELKIDGADFKDKEGRLVFLRGINLGSIPTSSCAIAVLSAELSTVLWLPPQAEAQRCRWAGRPTTGLSSSRSRRRRSASLLANASARAGGSADVRSGVRGAALVCGAAVRLAGGGDAPEAAARRRLHVPAAHRDVGGHRALRARGLLRGVHRLHRRRGARGGRAGAVGA